ncbi:hypothetical protein J6590_039310 [Homalodisca vitripennis]|nr:hypothetical protein J6590_039310 [Homalodisca vitripennis]
MNRHVEITKRCSHCCARSEEHGSQNKLVLVALVQLSHIVRCEGSCTLFFPVKPNYQARFSELFQMSQAGDRRHRVVLSQASSASLLYPSLLSPVFVREPIAQL